MKTTAEKFEKIVHDSLKEAGLLFPISENEIEQFENKFTKLPLPNKLKDPHSILERNQDKLYAATQPTLQVAALFQSSQEEMPLKKSKRKSKGKK